MTSGGVKLTAAGAEQAHKKGSNSSIPSLKMVKLSHSAGMETVYTDLFAYSFDNTRIQYLPAAHFHSDKLPAKVSDQSSHQSLPGKDISRAPAPCPGCAPQKHPCSADESPESGNLFPANLSQISPHRSGEPSSTKNNFNFFERLLQKASDARSKVFLLILYTGTTTETNIDCQLES